MAAVILGIVILIGLILLNLEIKRDIEAQQPGLKPSRSEYLLRMIKRVRDKLLSKI